MTSPRYDCEFNLYANLNSSWQRVRTQREIFKKRKNLRRAKHHVIKKRAKAKENKREKEKKMARRERTEKARGVYK